MSALQRQLLTENVPPLPSLFHAEKDRKPLKKRGKEYTPLPWEGYFERSEDVKVGVNNYQIELEDLKTLAASGIVYFAGSVGPIVLVLHGGGHSALSWALFTCCECQVVAVDMRGHGDTSTANDSDLSKETLTNDVEQLMSSLFHDTTPPVIVVGHSMGGAVAVHTAVQGYLPSLAGLVVIDVVEGTAMGALGHMQTFLQSRPQAFKSVEKAIEWSVRSDQVRNLESARVSVPKQFKWVGSVQEVNGETATSVPQAKQPRSCIDQQPITELEEEEEEEEDASIGESEGDDSTKEREECRREEGEREREEKGITTVKEGPDSSTGAKAKDGVITSDSSLKPPLGTGATCTVNSKPTVSGGFYTWRIDLRKTEQFWKGWFTGLSQNFLSCPVPKILILAGTDRLDKELTIGQMQGKFELQVMSGCGHLVHEDIPDKVADRISSFLIRHKLAQAKDSHHP